MSGKSSVSRKFTAEKKRAVGNLVLGDAYHKNSLRFLTLSWGKRKGRFLWKPKSHAFADLITEPLDDLKQCMRGNLDFVICAGRAVNLPHGFDAGRRRRVETTWMGTGTREVTGKILIIFMKQRKTPLSITMSGPYERLDLNNISMREISLRGENYEKLKKHWSP